ncbi:hypothetical protein OH687_01445 [Burkholderia anthina]|nr:hypothetical protein OH687_01445 [Burkholderia anthina]
MTERELRAGNGIERHGETAKREIGSAHCTGRGGRHRLGWMDEGRRARSKRVGAVP